MKLWIKTTKGDKLTAAVTTAEIETATIGADELRTLMHDALDPLDIPTPNVIRPNVVQLARFNMTRFKPYDFVEHVDFNLMTVEALRSDEEKRPHRRTPLDEV